jgi:uncharacterized protein (TIGR03437 family)
LTAILIAAGATTLHAQNVAVDKSSLSFSALSGGPAVSQQLTISSSTSSAITFFASANSAWVKINGQNTFSGSTPATVSVSVDPSGLLPGTYSSSVSIFGGANNLSVSISLTVSNIGASPSSVSFTGYTAGSGNVPAQQSITLTGATTTFTAAASTTTGGSWLQVTPTSGTSPGTIFAVLNTVIVPGLAAGTYQGSITITPTSGTVTTPVVIPVSLTVSTAPVVVLTPSALQFNVQIGGTNNITSQPFYIDVAPPQQVSFGLVSSVDPNPAGKNWITTNPPSGTTNPQNGDAPITVGVDVANLPANTYSGKITVITPGATPAQQDVPVKLLISTTQLLNVPATPLTFVYQSGAALPAAQSINVTATSGSLAYTATTSANSAWLSVPATGSTAAPLTVSVNPAGLAVGTYTASITITGSTAGTGTQQVPVVLRVTNDPIIVTNLSSMSFPFQIGQAAPASQLLKITSSTGAPLNYTATPTESSCTGATWLLVNNAGSAVSGSTDASLVVGVNTAGLPAGTCTGKISITATVASTGAPAINSPLDVIVTLYVSNSPMLVFSPVQPPVFNVALGATSAPAQNITLSSTSAAAADQLSYTATFQTASGGNWLFVGPLSGTTTTGNVLTVSVIPSLVSAGTYTGTIVVTATNIASPSTPVANSPVTIPVTLTVSAGSLTVSPTSLTFSQVVGSTAPAAQTVTLGSSGTPLTYSVATNTGTNTWLTVTPTSGNTSANGTLTVTADGSKLPAATYTGTITVSAPGAGNSPATSSVTLVVSPGTISAPTTTLTFNQVVGGPAPATQTIAVTGTPGTINFTATASSGASWLSVSPSNGTTPGTVTVSANAGSLGVGQYTGNVTIAAAGASGSPITVPVVLNVVTGQTLTVNPASLSFNYTVGGTAPATQQINVTTTGSAIPVNAQVQISQPAGWLQVSPASSTTPAVFTVTATAGSLSPGTYNTNITISSPASLTPVNVPVTFTIVQIPKPVISAIGNAGSYATGGISPGENIVIFGTGVGPATLANGTVANNAWGTVAGNTRVLFDGVAAPVIYASATQTSVMVPYGINGRPTTSVVVEYSGVQSNALTYNVVAAAPGIYTQNSQGTGPGSVLNQNGSVNTPSVAAARGSVISVYMTGEGQTSPAGVDGVVIPPVASALKTPLLPVTASIGGVPAAVQYAGSAPGIVSGVMQVNVLIPANAPTGGAVPILITVGTANTQTGVTISVQ